VATSRWVYNKATGEFLRGGFYEVYYDDATEGIAEFPDSNPFPDRRLQRYDAVTGLRSATPEEVAAYDEAQADAAAAREVSMNKAMVAVAFLCERHRLGRVLTPQERQAIRDELKSILRTL